MKIVINVDFGGFGNGVEPEFENLQVLTWFENRAKCDMANDEWQEFKLKTKITGTYFVQMF